ncbi:CmcI family methyltransferase [Tistrella mobilis]|uniref:CmcI family methyltransferase n=1 Tax=Tistrella mobilis TaxID=171437 RepID=UPI0035565C6D
MTDRSDATVQFMRASFDGFAAGRRTYHVSWLGHDAIKYPTDLMMYQELICRRRPALIVETGSFKGGSGLFLASICDLIGAGEVISIDLHNDERRADLPVHPRLTFLSGSSTAPEMVRAVYDRAAALGPDAEVMVILDSDHRLLHVLAELEAYAGLVRPGGYLIVEDGHVNGRPNWPDYGPGPSEAIAFFLPRHPEFEVDPACERFMMTLNPGGYLRRRDDPA